VLKAVFAALPIQFDLLAKLNWQCSNKSLKPSRIKGRLSIDGIRMRLVQRALKTSLRMDKTDTRLKIWMPLYQGLDRWNLVLKNQLVHRNVSYEFALLNVERAFLLAKRHCSDRANSLN
jgi:hypothetical protein